MFLCVSMSTPVCTAYITFLLCLNVLVWMGASNRFARDAQEWIPSGTRLKINHMHIGHTLIPLYRRNIWLVFPALITC